MTYIIEKPHAWVLAHPEVELSPSQSTYYRSAVQRLMEGEPLAYVIGEWEFFGLKFLVSQATLIPRPETEVLVEYALEWLENRGNESLVIDIGTGSGCIAVALACNNPDIKVIASDISSSSLTIASRNIDSHGCTDRVYCVQADLVPPISIRATLISANLPYIPTGRLKSLNVYQKEPTEALDGGIDGLSFIRKLLYSLVARVVDGGLILLEIDCYQAKKIKKIAASTYPGAEIFVIKDLAGLDRLVAVHLP
jgi:release factor glutamine methyltransferase